MNKTMLLADTDCVRCQSCSGHIEFHSNDGVMSHLAKKQPKIATLAAVNEAKRMTIATLVA